MSRTDKTRPYRVKMLDSTSNFREAHNHGKRPLLDERGRSVYVPDEGRGPNVVRRIMVDHPECDLPASPWDRDDRPFQYHACHYTHTTSWVHSGEARCGCPVCSDTAGRKKETRKKRRAAKRATQNWRDEF